MECRTCERSDSSRRFYCHNCVSTRLAEHYQIRSKLRAIISNASAKAIDLLTPPGSGSGDDSGARWGVQEERELKAERFSKGCRLRDARIAVEKGREELTAAKTSIEARKEALQARRTKLTEARHLLTSLSTPSTSPKLSSDLPPPPPQSLQSLTSQSNSTQRSLNDLNLRIEETRLILARELMTVYALQPTPDAVPNPFSSHKSSSNKPGSISSSASSLNSISSNTSASNVLSSLSATAPYHIGILPLPLLPLPPTHPSMTTLLHLTRLLGLYYSLSLPYTPLPNLFGPGKPGIRASPSHGTGSFSSSGDRWPLFLDLEASGPGEVLVKGDKVKEKERERARVREVRKGMCALTYDLAWIVWKRGGEVRDVEECRDLGRLIGRAVGAPSPASVATGISRPHRPTLPTMRPPSASFPIAFQSFLDAFAEEDVKEAEEAKDKLRKRLEKHAASSTTVAGEEGEEEWDLI